MTMAMIRPRSNSRSPTSASATVPMTAGINADVDVLSCSLVFTCKFSCPFVLCHACQSVLVAFSPHHRPFELIDKALRLPAQSIMTCIQYVLHLQFVTCIQFVFPLQFVTCIQSVLHLQSQLTFCVQSCTSVCSCGIHPPLQDGHRRAGNPTPGTCTEKDSTDTIVFHGATRPLWTAFHSAPEACHCICVAIMTCNQSDLHLQISTCIQSVRHLQIMMCIQYVLHLPVKDPQAPQIS